MFTIGDTRRKLSELARSFTVEALCSGTTAQSVEAALATTGRGGQRASPLDPKLMMWLVLCLPIFRSDSISAVLSRLLSGLRDLVLTLSLRPVDDDAIAHARRRLGVAPLREFFRAQAQEIRPDPSFHGLRVWSIDGSTLSMPDTPENRETFGLPKTARGCCGFPHLKIVALQDVFSRRLRDVAFRKWNASERDAAAGLLGNLEDGDLVLLDRGFYGFWFFQAIRARKSHFLVRVPSYVKLKPVRGTSKKSGDYLAWIQGKIALPEGQTIQGRRGRPATHVPVRMLVRVIEYQIRGFERVRLITSLLDPEISAREWVLEYHRRWEIEISLDEMKTHQSSTAQGTPRTIFRSRTPRNVMQEAYALVAAYNLIRGTIAHAAERHGLDPDKISFVGTFRAISHMLPRMRGARAHELVRLHDQLLLDIAEALIDRPRRARAYPRVVKVKMSNFKRKRPHHRQVLVDFRTTIRIGA